ncbi:hypothetical protein HS962_01210 [Pantoea sp. BIGb0393]|uniref:Uncharacterized protein n=1 Tax=Pantoea nemavictus TaxID=2726955 RepID=A0ABU8PPC2_9GAMM|nr:hypothetical protein [Pantoea nemavictus]MBA0034861.1 hypothetical protein [Pantoea nemavictus]
MKNSNDKQLSDVVIGDAVIELFTHDAAISRTTLIAQLEKMIQAGGTPERIRVARLALAEVNRSSQCDEEESDEGVINMLAKSAVVDDSTKH